MFKKDFISKENVVGSPTFLEIYGWRESELLAMIVVGKSKLKYQLDYN